MSTLYLDHFGLKKPPFQITPDPDFFFSGGQRGPILGALVHVATHDEGISTVVAEVGSGKTLLARLMIAQLPPALCSVYLANPCFNRDEIIEAISRDLGLPDLVASREGKLAALQQELVRRHAAGQRVLLVIDEAHTMPIESIEEVRLLSNIESAQHKLVNIMLFGQPELDDLLAQPNLRQLRDRVIHRFDLERLHADEIGAYIDHRLRVAGWSSARLFSLPALAHLVRVSDGRARRINLLADKALLAAYSLGKQEVDEAQVSSAASELPSGQLGVARKRLQPWGSPPWHMITACLGAAALGALVVWAALGAPWGRGAGAAATTNGVLEQSQPTGSPPLRFESSLAAPPKKTDRSP